jgi:hypothetical protein
MADALFLLPDNPLSPAGWLPQGSALVTEIVFVAETCGSGSVLFYVIIESLQDIHRSIASPSFR